MSLTLDWQVQPPGIGEFPPGARMAPRVLDEFELVWMIAGTARLVAEPPLGLAPGDLVLLPAGHAHAIEWDGARSTRHGYVHFLPPARVVLPTEPVRVRMSAHDPLTGLCDYLSWLGAQATPDPAGPAAQVVEFLLTVLLDLPLPVPGAEQDGPPSFRAAVDHLRSVWGVPPVRRGGVVDLAAAAAVSRAQLHRAFRATVGVGPAQALEQLRCSRAETMLLRTDLTLAVVARECGYADVAHFSHRFCAIHAVAPGQYRRSGGSSCLAHPGIRQLERLVWG
jgi:AraC-like DNA-binding protein